METKTNDLLKYLAGLGLVAIVALFAYRACSEEETLDLSSIGPGSCITIEDPDLFDMTAFGAGWNKPFVYTCKSPFDTTKPGVWVLIPLDGCKAVPVITEGAITYDLIKDGSDKKVMICFYEFEEEIDVVIKTMEGGGNSTTVVVTADKDTEQPISDGGSVPFSGFASTSPCLVVFTGEYSAGSGTADGVGFTWTSTGAVFVAPKMGPGHTPSPTEYSASTIEPGPVRAVRVVSR